VVGENPDTANKEVYMLRKVSREMRQFAVLILAVSSPLLYFFAWQGSKDNLAWISAFLYLMCFLMIILGV
jgi:hypothetical protein